MYNILQMILLFILLINGVLSAFLLIHVTNFFVHASQAVKEFNEAATKMRKWHP